MEENISGDVIELNGYGDMQPESQPAQHEDDSYYVSRREWEQKTKTRKLTVVITYAIAVVFLLAGLFAPLFTFVKGGNMGDMIMFKYLMAFVHGLIPSVSVPESGWFAATATWVPLGSFDAISLVDLLLILTTFISVFMIIPVVLCKKEGNAYKNCALIVEIIAISLMGLHLVLKSVMLYPLPYNFVDYNIFIALCGTMIMAVIQSIATKGSLGVFRLFSLLLAFLALITWIGYVTFIPKISEPMGKFANSLKASNGFYSETVKSSEISIEMPQTGLVGIYMLINAKDIKLFSGGTILGVNNILIIMLSLLLIINFIFDTAELNLGAKFKKDYNASSNVFCNAILLTRYVLSFLTACVIMIFCFSSEALTCGIYLYILLVILFIALALAIVRTVIDGFRVKRGIVAPANMRVALYDPNFNKEKKPEPAPLPEPEPEPVTIIQQQPQQPQQPQIQILDYTSPYYDQQPQQPYIMPVAAPPQPEYEEEEPEPEPEPLPAVLPEPEPEPEPAPKPREYPDGYDSTPFMDYTEDVKKTPEPKEEEPEPEPEEPVYVYAGETDDFIDTLADSEKVEFYETFIRKSKGEVNGVPDYQIGGKNEEFFSSVFVHINRFRSLISDTLLGKMYKQLGKVNLDED